MAQVPVDSGQNYVLVFIFLSSSLSSCRAAAVGPLGDSPVQVVCPSCHQAVLTKVDPTSGLLTYLLCGGLFFCGNIISKTMCFTYCPLSFVLGCCLIPFCVDRLRDARHSCPTCKTVLGVYKRL
ncbi:lipopolysaccharide-induced tumor necrosis factor-alpha factor homolog [Hippoglossus hippoglossus]|uniref:lipopolysaccharide-induced tumor necrosis factor-alpha factor homolog n=1 Tax=Hippoglossus hippoglossus TaxID=8267 RepID=UPI00148DE827|nr:lipopolysaccharide-induced tumor necrosis factor-alpha factor homolog [Hippoglossus hippoglossus]